MNRALFVILFLSVISCNRNSKTETSSPESLTIGFPLGTDPAIVKHRNIITDYLQHTLGLKKVDFYVSSDYATIIEAMKTKKIDIAYFGELSYILAHEKAGAESMVMTTLTDGSLPSGSIIITYPGSGLNSMDDVKKRSHGLKLLFSDPASTSGHLYPREYLTRIGLEPEKAFKQVAFAEGHSACILSIKSHKVDLACTWKFMINYLEETGKIKSFDYKILWVSGNYPASPIAIRKDLPEKFKERIKQAYLDWPKKEPASWENFKNHILLFYPKEIRKKIIYTSASDTLYNPIRRIIKSSKNLNFYR